MITIIDVLKEIDAADLPEGYKLKSSNGLFYSLSRDFFSSIPLFYVYEKKQLVLASSYIELVGFLKSKSQTIAPDLDYMKYYITFQAPYTSRTLSKNIRLIRPGEQLLFKSNGDCKTNIFKQSLSNENKYTYKDLRSSIESIVGDLDPKNTVFHISSGLDSSILAITAARIFPRHNIRLATCKTRGVGCSDELNNSKRLADEIGADIMVYDFSSIDVFKEGKEFIKNCLGYPIAHPSHLVEYLLDKKIVESEADTIVNGKGPDDCLAGYPWHFEQYRLATAHKNRMMITSEIELLELTGGAIDPLSIEHYWGQANKTLTLKQRLEYDVRSLTEAWNIIHCAIANELKVNIVSPFMDRRIRANMFALKDDLKINGSENKYFLRQSFFTDYPNYILGFSKHGLKLDLRNYFTDYSSEELFSKITCGATRVEQYFSINKIKDMIEMTLSGRKNYGWQLWSIFCLTTAMQY